MRPINFNPAEDNSLRPTHYIPLKSLPFKNVEINTAVICPDQTTENPYLNVGQFLQNVTVLYVHTSRP